MKTFIGTVVAAKMEKSATVEVSFTWTHPKYKKTVKKSKKYIVHNDIGAKEGDVVELQEVRPMSRLKRFNISKVLESSRLAAVATK